MPPTRIFDACLHVIDPRFPTQENEGYRPAPFTVADYRARTAALPIGGGTVVAGSFQGLDKTWIPNALSGLGPGFAAVAQVPADASDEELRELDRLGVRAVRFNLHRGGSAGREHLAELGRRVHALCGWHVELYVDARGLGELRSSLAALPCVVVDHLGLSAEALPELLRLVGQGGRVKLSGLSRYRGDPAAAVRALVAAAPHALMFGTDLPSTRATPPFSDTDVDRIADLVGPDAVDAVFWSNAAELYRPPR